MADEHRERAAVCIVLDPLLMLYRRLSHMKGLDGTMFFGFSNALHVGIGKAEHTKGAADYNADT